MAKKKPIAVVFIHGLAKKPPPEKLQELWLWGLERSDPMPNIFTIPNPGLNLLTKGIPFFFNYYADVFYGKDYDTDYKSYYENTGEALITTANLTAVAGELNTPKPITPREARFLAALSEKLSAQIVEDAVPPTTVPTSALAAIAPGQLEIASWLPQPVKEAIIKKAAMEAYYFLFNKEYERSDGARYRVRVELRDRLVNDLRAALLVADKVVLVSHSMGTMVAYDVLRNVSDCPKVDTLITLGSPLGITEVQDELRATDAKELDFPAMKLDHWVNIFDPIDPVCGADPRFANDYAKVDGKGVEDVEESNWGSWRHTITHYLAGKKCRAALAKSLNVDLPS